MRRTKVTDHISMESIAKMIPCFKPLRKQYQKGDIITYYESGEPDSVAILESGAAKLEVSDANGEAYAVDRYEPGDIFGGLFSMPLENYQYTVIATKDSSVVYLDYKHIITPCDKVCSHHSQLISNLFMMTAQKSQELSLHISILGQNSTKNKLLTYLKHVRSNEGKKGSEEFQIPMSLSSLAEYLMVDRSAMMRAIKDLKDAGIIESRNKTFRMM